MKCYWQNLIVVNSNNANLVVRNYIKCYNNFIISAIKFGFLKWKKNSGNELIIKEKNVIACCQNAKLQKLIKFNYSFWWRFFIFLVSLSFCSHSSFCELKSNQITQWQQIYLPWFEQITKRGMQWYSSKSAGLQFMHNESIFE